jgi:tight adherence protein C
MEQIAALLEIQNAITLLVAISAFATVLTVASPYFQTDKLRGRMKSVSTERDRLRAQQKAALNQNDNKLRETPKGTMSQIVEALNLRELLKAENSRSRLRQAGFRSESHLVTFLVARIGAPIVLSLITFIYSSTVFADQIPESMRLIVPLVGGVAGFYLPNMFLSNIIQRRQQSIKSAWSDALDLLLICVESGMSIEAAIQRVSLEIGATSVPLAEELTLTNAELSFLGDRRKAFVNLGERTGLPTVRSVVTSLVQSERYGTPLGTALRVLAQENRDSRMQEAEKKAAALPPKLTVPMVLFFLPVIFMVLIGPSIILVLDLG